MAASLLEHVMRNRAAGNTPGVARDASASATVRQPGKERLGRTHLHSRRTGDLLMMCWVIATASLTIAAALSSIRANPTNSWLPSAQARMEVENEQGSRFSLRGRGVSDLFRDVSLRDWFCRQPARAEID